MIPECFDESELPQIGESNEFKTGLLIATISFFLPDPLPLKVSLTAPTAPTVRFDLFVKISPPTVRSPFSVCARSGPVFVKARKEILTGKESLGVRFVVKDKIHLGG